PRRARSRWPSEFRLCCWEFRVTIHIQIIRKPIACVLAPERAAARRAPVCVQSLDLIGVGGEHEVFAEDRRQPMRQCAANAFLTVNEKRLAAGYGPIEGGDVFHQSN